MSEAPLTYDLLLKGGRIVDPANDRDGAFDIAVKDGRIAAISPEISAADAQETIDISGKLALPGMIDTHAHVYEHVTGKFGLNPDMVGVGSGVTTLVDQGGPSCMTIPGFREFIVKPSASRVMCFISCYLVGGLEGHLYPELYGPGGVNVAHTSRAATAHADLVRGIKAHAEIGGASRWGLEVIKLGKEIARSTGLPLYIHLGQLWPTEDQATVDADEVVRALMPLMEPGDILAHPFTRHPGGFVSAETGEVHPVVWEAIDRGVKVDVGHGSHFSFDMAHRVIQAGLRPDTLGADMHGLNVRKPQTEFSNGERETHPFFGVAPFSLSIAMSELLALGMTLSETVATVTSNAAAMLGESDRLGALTPGRAADISVLDKLSGRFRFTDNSGDEMTADTLVHPAFCLREGRRYEANSPLLPEPDLIAL